MTLINYGLQNEESDLRIHVSVCNSTAYYFLTYNGKQALQIYNIGELPAYQNGVIGATALGIPMPIKNIPGICSIKIPEDVFISANFPNDPKLLNTTQKGEKATYIVKEMLKRNLIPIEFKIDEIKDRRMQISGTDILVSARYRIQVKCDWRAGETGNLYLQTQERNPLKMR